MEDKGGVAGVGSLVAIVPGIQVDARVDLPEVVQARRPLRPRLGAGKHRQQQRRQNADDGDDHEQFRQRERAACGCRACIHHGIHIYNRITVGQRIISPRPEPWPLRPLE